MGPHWGRVEGQENLPRPAGHTPLDAPQDPIGLLGSQGTLLAHGQLVVNPSPTKRLHVAQLAWAQAALLSPALLRAAACTCGTVSPESPLLTALTIFTRRLPSAS